MNRCILPALLVLSLLPSPARADEPGFLRLTGQHLRAPFTPSGATLLGLGTLGATGAWVWALKLSIGAPRPTGAPHSFPSGHTAVTFATATTVQRHFGAWTGFAAYTLATMTAAARMEDGGTSSAA